MYNVLIILMVIVSILMCLIVLIQESKGGGLASNFASSNQIMGVRKTTDVIEKTTWTLAILMVVISVVSAYVVPKASDSQSVMNNATTMPVVPQQQSAPLQNATPNAQGSQQGQSEAPQTPAN